MVFPGVDAVSLRPLLDFDSTRVQAYTRESSIAEKLQAMVKLGSINSRMNDFFDLWYLSTSFDFRGEDLAAAVDATFKARGTAIPSEVTAFSAGFADSPEKQAQWASFRRKSRLEEAPESFAEVVGQIASFVAPVLGALADGRSFHLSWACPGPWEWGWQRASRERSPRDFRNRLCSRRREYGEYAKSRSEARLDSGFLSAPSCRIGAMNTPIARSVCP